MHPPSSNPSLQIRARSCYFSYPVSSFCTSLSAQQIADYACSLLNISIALSSCSYCSSHVHGHRRTHRAHRSELLYHQPSRVQPCQSNLVRSSDGAPSHGPRPCPSSPRRFSQDEQRSNEPYSAHCISLTPLETPSLVQVLPVLGRPYGRVGVYRLCGTPRSCAGSLCKASAEAQHLSSSSTYLPGLEGGSPI